MARAGGIVPIVLLSGRSDWLEDVQLLAVYLVLAQLAQLRVANQIFRDAALSRVRHLRAMLGGFGRVVPTLGIFFCR